MVDGSELGAFALRALGNNTDLSVFLEERVQALVEEIERLSCVDAPDEILDRVRRIQVLRQLADDIRSFGDVADEQLQSDTSPERR